MESLNKGTTEKKFVLSHFPSIDMSRLSPENLERILDRVQNWISSADQKISILFGFQSLSITIGGPSLVSWLVNNLSRLSNLDLMLLVIGFILFFVGFSKSVICLVPRLKNIHGQSITYFGDISRLKLEDYQKLISQVDTEYLSNDLIRQIHISSVIAKKKHEHFKDAVYSYLLALILIAIPLITFFFSTNANPR